MAFDQSTVSAATHSRSGAELLVSWSSTSPEGTTFQVYVAGRLAGSTSTRHLLIPWPRSRARIDVGAVAAGEESADFSGDLTPGPQDRVLLEWAGGTYLGVDLAGYRVYGSTGTPVVAAANLLGTVPAYSGGSVTDGFGMGGFGSGGFGSAAASYTFTTAPLAGGTWTFAVVPYDLYGNVQGSPATVVQAVASPPRPPAANAAGKRLTYTYNSGTRVVTLSWLASPA